MFGSACPCSERNVLENTENERAVIVLISRHPICQNHIEFDEQRKLSTKNLRQSVTKKGNGGQRKNKAKEQKTKRQPNALKNSVESCFCLIVFACAVPVVRRTAGKECNKID